MERPRSRPDRPAVLALPILISGLAPTSSNLFGGAGAGGGAGGGGSGVGIGGGLGVSTFGDPPPPIHIINSPFELGYILRPNVDQHDT